MEKSKLYYLASLTCSDFKLMVELYYKMMQKFIIDLLPSELSNPIILNSLYIVIEFYLVFTFPLV